MIRRSDQSPPLPNVVLLFCITLYLAGCTTTPSTPITGSGPGAAMDWTLRGKMALRSDQGHANMQIHWQQRGDEFDIHISGPLGQSAAHVFGSSESLQIDAAGQSRKYKANEIELVKDSLGWEIPVKEMSFWVRGLPVPDLYHEISYDNRGLPYLLLQSGWQVEYKKFKRQAPVRTIFTRGPTRILLVIKEWRLNDTK
jgi:outer membrane lipoprotein LolB